MNRRGNGWFWASMIGAAVLLCLFLFAVFVGVPRYEMEETVRLVTVNDHEAASPLPASGSETLCAGNVTISQGDLVAMGDGMTYAMFASGDGVCAYKTQVRVVRWRRLFG